MEENWKVGKHPSQVVSDVKQRNSLFPSEINPETGPDSDIEYYGGYLVCESVGTEKYANLIASAPDMLRALLAAKAVFKAQGINENHTIVGEQYKIVIDAIKKTKITD